jgi:Flp pilus assembly pilin Flp
MAECGIVVALIAVVSILVVGALGIDAFTAFDQSQSNMDPGADPPPTP